MTDQSPDKGRQAPQWQKDLYAEWIRQAMADRSMHVEQLAELSGVSPQTIHELRNGQRIVFATMTDWLAEVLEVHVSPKVASFLRGTRSYTPQRVQAAQRKLRAERGGAPQPTGLGVLTPSELCDRVTDVLCELAERATQPTLTLDAVVEWLRTADLDVEQVAQVAAAVMERAQKEIRRPRNVL